MSSYLLEIQPCELKFILELQKQNSCTVRLDNKTDQHVGFKVKTTSPKKYCVRPNVGIIQPKGTCEFVVTMQALQFASPNMICKDKFLIQSTTVPAGTMAEDITSDMFLKLDGQHIEERKLNVVLVSPSLSPDLSPINGTLRDEMLRQEERLVPHDAVDVRLEESKAALKEDLKPVKNREFEPIKDVGFKPVKVVESVRMNDMDSKLTKDVETIAMNDKNRKGMNDVRLEMVKDMEQRKLVKDIEEMMARLSEFEAKLSKAEVTISKLTEERRLTFKETEILRRELALMRSREAETRVGVVGFPLLFVCIAAFVSVVFGYALHA
ncbi:hypothetical protein Nepgr_012300 [Nepenthes gracilis]|uniref:MSP domain-containing protein n=1 Tax=Nepenthes gracilis TaxID=150966 RepID=A0AAD3SH13_NEPGR|nr:hypothetical protein Nepgr_012300 [Nepenthes gracilis]